MFIDMYQFISLICVDLYTTAVDKCLASPISHIRWILYTTTSVIAQTNKSTDPSV